MAERLSRQEMGERIDSDPDYEGVIDPAFYQERAIFYGGLRIARRVGNIVKDSLPIKGAPSPHILDIAAGTGIVARHLSSLGYDIEATDASQSFLAYLNEQDPTIPTAVGDMNGRLPYGDGSFDGLVTSWANRFITDVDHFTRSAHGLLKPDGFFFWPIAIAETHLWQKRATTLIEFPNIIDSLDRAGFEQIESKKVPSEYKLLHPGSAIPEVVLVAKK